ncbi:Alcohol dehydrogenase [NADP(+)] [Stylophora pistillata]|uniref:Alcohol dehydrogenase [NADP(+)] n=1 Tax=Stylophora pistillata TaxID=50429 RepID=A0A2B4SCB2_STYPI|nr:Alcohol dehydrogenase [NADP(+)] [Stylophora pistillata]
MKQVSGDDLVHRTIETAFQCGYRLIDTAAVYQNEANIGEALKKLLPKYSLSRSDIFITSKLSPRDHGFENTEKAFMKSLKALDCEYLDLYLIHWPGVQKLKSDDPRNAELRQESWKALEKLYSTGLVKSIGVSNYTVDHLEELLQFSTVMPAVLQLLEETTVRALAAQHSKSTAQVLLKWALQHDVGVIPKSVKAQHIKDNIFLADFHLSQLDMEALGRMHTNSRFCWDPTKVK